MPGLVFRGDRDDYAHELSVFPGHRFIKYSHRCVYFFDAVLALGIREDQAVFDSTAEFGPYYVLTDNMALIHATNKVGVNKTQMAVTVLREPVQFEEDGADVQILIALCAVDANAHIDGMATVLKLFGDDDRSVKTASKTGLVVTAEEHNIIGGLGGAVAECLADKCPTRMLRIGVRDRFGESGSAGELLHKYELDGEGLYRQIKEFYGLNK